MRLKNRYFLLEISFDDGNFDSSLHAGIIVSAIRSVWWRAPACFMSFSCLFLEQVVQTLNGDFGLACVQGSLAGARAPSAPLCVCKRIHLFACAVKYFEVLTNMVVVRVARDHEPLVAAALPFVTALKGRECRLTLLHLGGTIRSCQRALVAHHQRELRQLSLSATSDPAAAAAYARLAACEPIISASAGP